MYHTETQLKNLRNNMINTIEYTLYYSATLTTYLEIKEQLNNRFISQCMVYAFINNTASVITRDASYQPTMDAVHAFGGGTIIW
jgi:hypothetical protein